MKDVAFVLLLLLVVNRGSGQSQYKVMGIGFYNCENLFDPTHDPNKNDMDFTPDGLYHYTEQVYTRKLHNIATVIEKMGMDITPDGPAILGLAGVENEKVLNDLVNQPGISNRNYKYIWFYTPDERGMGTALLYNPKYLEVLHAEPLHVPLETIRLKKAARDVLHVTGVTAGDTVDILVNYWPSRQWGETMSAAARNVAATVDKRIVDSLLKVNPARKILIIGDFSDNPTGESISGVLEAKASANQTDLTDIYNPWVSEYKKGLGTENYMGEWNLPDQIMVSGSFLKNDNHKWKYYNSEIYNRDFLVYSSGRYNGMPHKSFTATHVWDDGYSDHFPVLIYLIKKK